MGLRGLESGFSEVGGGKGRKGKEEKGEREGLTRRIQIKPSNNVARPRRRRDTVRENRGAVVGV